MNLVLNWLVNTVGLWVATKIVPGVYVEDPNALIVAALVIGLINTIVRPILAVITFPITVLTLGLFYFVLNGAMLYLAAEILPGFALEGMPTAVVASIVMSIVATVLHLFLRPKKKRG
ncbi:MAG: phage holin family protein [Gemmatimonadota bacterium]